MLRKAQDGATMQSERGATSSTAATLLSPDFVPVSEAERRQRAAHLERHTSREALQWSLQTHSSDAPAGAGEALGHAASSEALALQRARSTLGWDTSTVRSPDGRSHSVLLLPPSKQRALQHAEEHKSDSWRAAVTSATSVRRAAKAARVSRRSMRRVKSHMLRRRNRSKEKQRSKGKGQSKDTQCTPTRDLVGAGAQAQATSDHQRHHHTLAAVAKQLVFVCKVSRRVDDRTAAKWCKRFDAAWREAAATQTTVK